MSAAYIAAAIFFLCATYLGYNYKRKRFPKGYKAIKAEDAADVGKRTDPTRDSFAKKKIPENLDAIVIGSGLGSLTTASLLARCGWKVLVLEQHYIAGGCTHTFDDKGYEFDTGLHYVGGVHKYGKLIDICSVEEKVEWEPQRDRYDSYNLSRSGAGEKKTDSDQLVYDVLAIGDMDKFACRAGEENYVSDLIERFPDEADGIRKYVQHVHAAADAASPWFILKLLPQWVNTLFGGFIAGKFRSYAAMNAQQVVDSCVKNKQLRALLLGQAGDSGGPPDSNSFFIVAGISTHYYEGGFYPVGGPASIARAMIPTIERAGGRVLVRAPVSEIILDRGGKARGVRCKDNDIFAKYIISGAGAINTYTKLLKPQQVPAYITEGIKKIGSSTTHFYGFIGLKGTTEELKLPASNLWVLPCKDDYDINKLCRVAFEDPLGNEMMLFIGFPSAKDPSWHKRFPDKSTCVIITESNYDMFERWAEQRQGHREDSYQELKGKIGQKMLDGLFKHFPHLKDRVEYQEFATPISAKYFLNAERGESYGLNHSPLRYGPAGDFLRPASPIPNLYLTGQDILTNGIAGALGSGVVTTHAILGYPSVLDIITGRDMMKDIVHLIATEDSKQKSE